MTFHSSRRSFLSSAAAMAPVLAFSPSAKAWVVCGDEADAVEIPGLDGVILSSPSDRAAAAQDWGYVVSKTPIIASASAVSARVAAHPPGPDDVSEVIPVTSFKAPLSPPSEAETGKTGGVVTPACAPGSATF